MKNLILSSATILAFTLSSFTGKNIHIDVYKVDTKLSSLGWYAEKVTGKHNGTIMLSGGEIKNDHGKFSGNIEVDMNSIANKDVEDEKYRAKLENHLKSPDFFDAAKYPKAKFVTTSVTALKEAKEGGFTHTITGDLTIRDKTNPITFDAVIKSSGNSIVCVGTAIVDRSKYEVKYGSKTFYEDIGDKMIYDEFKLKFSLAANK